MARKLSFRAASVEAEPGPHDVVSLAFEAESDGDARVYFSMMAEDADEPNEVPVRVSWGDGKDGGDEVVISLSSASLSAERFKAEFKNVTPATLGPYTSVEVTFDALEDDAALSAGQALFALARPLGAQLKVDIEGASEPPGRASVGPPVKRGPPTLGVAAASAPWQVRTGETLSIALTLLNTGGPLQGISVEIGGAGLEVIRADALSTKGMSAPCERKGAVATAGLPKLALAADFDVDRKADKKAPNAPKTSLTLTLTAQKAGSGLLTIRVLAMGHGRSGSAMVGRTLVVS